MLATLTWSSQRWGDPVPYFTYPGGEIMAERREGNVQKIWPKSWLNQIKKGRKKEGFLRLGVWIRRQMRTCYFPSNARSCTWLDAWHMVHPIWQTHRSLPLGSKLFYQPNAPEGFEAVMCLSLTLEHRCMMLKGQGCWEPRRSSRHVSW